MLNNLSLPIFDSFVFHLLLRIVGHLAKEIKFISVNIIIQKQRSVINKQLCCFCFSFTIIALLKKSMI